MLESEELEEVIDKVIQKITIANRSGELRDLLKKIDLDYLLTNEPVYETYPDGKIVVIGDSQVKENELLGIAKSLGLDKNRFEFCLEYNKTKTYNYKKFKYEPKYRLVLFGPTPHSSTGKNDSSSVIAEMTTHEGYPRVEVLYANNEVKITKSNFKKALEDFIKEDFI